MLKLYCDQYRRQPGVVSVYQGRIRRAYSTGVFGARGTEGGGRLQLQKLQLTGPGGSLGAVSDPELAVDILDVFLHGAHRDHQPVGNLPV